MSKLRDLPDEPSIDDYEDFLASPLEKEDTVSIDLDNYPVKRKDPMSFGKWFILWQLTAMVLFFGGMYVYENNTFFTPNCPCVTIYDHAKWAFTDFGAWINMFK